jgi:protein involved in polysaccharide export with SLBB domain
MKDPFNQCLMEGLFMIRMVILLVVMASIQFSYSLEPLDNTPRSNWTFQTGDAIGISTTPDTGFPNGIYEINEYGCVNLPIIGTVNVNQIQKDSFNLLVKNAYIDYLRGPNLQIRHLIRISLLGGFLKPGLYWISPESTLWNAIYMAGGTIREDGIKKIRWERNGSLVKKTLVEDFQSGKTLRQLGFKSGDQISVTANQKLSGWDSFLKNVVPILSLAITCATAAATLSN